MFVCVCVCVSVCLCVCMCLYISIVNLVCEKECYYVRKMVPYLRLKCKQIIGFKELNGEMGKHSFDLLDTVK